MLGGDIFTVEFAHGIIDRCTVKGRPVPFVAYPQTDKCTEGLQKVRNRCTTFFAWAVGMGSLVLPDDVGVLIDPGNNIIMMDTYFENPGATAGCRKIEGGTLCWAISAYLCSDNPW